MSIQTEAKRVKFGQALTDLDTQIKNAVSQLEGHKANLLSMKTTVSADADFTAEDIAEIDAVIASAATDIQTLLE